MKYVDGFVLPIARDQLEEYRRIATEAGTIWKEYGALEYFECLGEDLEVQDLRGFPDMAGCKDGETVVFAWIVYESRAHRDEVNQKVMADPRIKNLGPEKMPFDCTRMACGGFEAIVEA